MRAVSNSDSVGGRETIRFQVEEGRCVLRGGRKVDWVETRSLEGLRMYVPEPKERCRPGCFEEGVGVE